VFNTQRLTNTDSEGGGNNCRRGCGGEP
jgi:hypothetical protein